MDFLEVFQKECKHYGFICEEYFGDIVIKTKYESWKVIPTNGKTTLYHKNAKVFAGASGSDYHKEFREQITPSNLVRYIYEHEAAKYTAKKSKPFSIQISSKQENYKKCKLRELRAYA